MSKPGVRWVLAGGAVFNALTNRFHGLSDYDFFLVLPPESGCYAEGMDVFRDLQYLPRGLEDPDLSSVLLGPNATVGGDSSGAAQIIPKTEPITDNLMADNSIFAEAVRKFVEALHRVGLVVDTYQRSSKALTLYVLTKEQAETLHHPSEEERKKLMGNFKEKPTKTFHQVGGWLVHLGMKESSPTRICTAQTSSFLTRRTKLTASFQEP